MKTLEKHIAENTLKQSNGATELNHETRSSKTALQHKSHKQSEAPLQKTISKAKTKNKGPQESCDPSYAVKR